MTGHVMMSARLRDTPSRSPTSSVSAGLLRSFRCPPRCRLRPCGGVLSRARNAAARRVRRAAANGALTAATRASDDVEHLRQRRHPDSSRSPMTTLSSAVTDSVWNAKVSRVAAAESATSPTVAKRSSGGRFGTARLVTIAGITTSARAAKAAIACGSGARSTGSMPTAASAAPQPVHAATTTAIRFEAACHRAAGAGLGRCMSRPSRREGRRPRGCRRTPRPRRRCPVARSCAPTRQGRLPSSWRTACRR